MGGRETSTSAVPSAQHSGGTRGARAGGWHSPLYQLGESTRMCRAEEVGRARAGSLWGVNGERRRSLSRAIASRPAPVFRKHYISPSDEDCTRGRPSLHAGSLPNGKSPQTSRPQPGAEIQREGVGVGAGNRLQWHSIPRLRWPGWPRLA